MRPGQVAVQGCSRLWHSMEPGIPDRYFSCFCFHSWRRHDLGCIFTAPNYRFCFTNRANLCIEDSIRTLHYVFFLIALPAQTRYRRTKLRDNESRYELFDLFS